MADTDPAPLTIEHFRPHVGQTYEAAPGEARVPLVLAAAEPLEGSVREGGGFRLEFTGPLDTLLDQVIHPLHRDGACQEIFLVPIAQSAQGYTYEAVFY